MQCISVFSCMRHAFIFYALLGTFLFYHFFKCKNKRSKLITAYQFNRLIKVLLCSKFCLLFQPKSAILLATSFRIYCSAFSYKSPNNSILQVPQTISTFDRTIQQNLLFISIKTTAFHYKTLDPIAQY